MYTCTCTCTCRSTITHRSYHFTPTECVLKLLGPSPSYHLHTHMHMDMATSCYSPNRLDEELDRFPISFGVKAEKEKSWHRRWPVARRTIGRGERTKHGSAGCDMVGRRSHTDACRTPSPLYPVHRVPGLLLRGSPSHYASPMLPFVDTNCYAIICRSSRLGIR